MRQVQGWTGCVPGGTGNHLACSNLVRPDGGVVAVEGSAVGDRHILHSEAQRGNCLGHGPAFDRRLSSEDDAVAAKDAQTTGPGAGCPGLRPNATTNGSMTSACQVHGFGDSR